MVAKTNRDRFVQEDAIESERKFVDPFICLICENIANNAVQCSSCKQIFDKECMNRDNCSKCGNKFIAEELNPNLLTMFG